MASEVELCNRALQKLGASVLVSLDDDSRNARSCNVAYVPCRDAELEEHTWAFSIKRAALAADGTAPTWGRAHCYTLPTDFLRLLPPYPEDVVPNPDWLIENGKIYTDDTAPLYIRYVARITDPNQMTPTFREALATRLAAEMAEDITQSNSKKAMLLDEYRMMIARARRTDAIQKPPTTAYDSPWITERA